MGYRIRMVKSIVVGRMKSVVVGVESVMLVWVWWVFGCWVGRVRVMGVSFLFCGGECWFGCLLLWLD